MSGGLDWPGLLRVGLRGWGCGPGVLAADARGAGGDAGRGGGAPPLTRDRLSELAARFPIRPGAI
ncbi:hypothetical protein ACTTAF_09035 [Rhodobacter capsulatus]|uniref:hypothetical protein n=1 Tax=Rhodobacter capsulatus TaxID=1061 RepID=UPI004038CB5A